MNHHTPDMGWVGWMGVGAKKHAVTPCSFARRKGDEKEKKRGEEEEGGNRCKTKIANIFSF